MNKKIITAIVEDEPSNSMFLKTAMEIKGHTIITFESAEEFIDYLEGKDVDLVMMDIKLKAMNGYDATRLIKKKYPDLKIIAQTAYALSGDREKALEAGCDCYISKPIDIEKLYRVVDDCLERE